MAFRVLLRPGRTAKQHTLERVYRHAPLAAANSPQGRPFEASLSPRASDASPRAGPNSICLMPASLELACRRQAALVRWRSAGGAQLQLDQLHLAARKALSLSLSRSLPPRATLEQRMCRAQSRLERPSPRQPARSLSLLSLGAPPTTCGPQPGARLPSACLCSARRASARAGYFRSFQISAPPDGVELSHRLADGRHCPRSFGQLLAASEPTPASPCSGPFDPIRFDSILV